MQISSQNTGFNNEVSHFDTVRRMGNDFRFDVDVAVINHLGIGLYSSTPAALTELVANAWDADATEVTITIDSSKNIIVIADNGHGMTPADIKEKFLKVGYSRRGVANANPISASGKRRVMGRKGIGKLAMFALAEDLLISSKTASTQAVGFKINVPSFRKLLEQHKSEVLPEFAPAAFPAGKGTRIEMRKVLTGLKTTESYLRVKLARRFSIIEGKNFTLKLNGTKVTRADRDFYQHVQFLWVFDTATRTAIRPLCSNLVSLPQPPDPKKPSKECVSILDNTVKIDGKLAKIRGYIASVALPKQLGSKDDSANMISVFANGRVFAENVLQEASSAKYYQNYLVGELHADFLDADAVDRATASRESIKRDDPKYQALLSLLRTSLEEISKTWDDWRVDLGIDPKEPQNEAIVNWIASLPDDRDRKAAMRLMTSIKNATIHSDDQKNAVAQAVLYRGAIVGFEKLRLKNQLSKLDGLTDVLSPEFAAIFANLDSLEETSYAEITQQRLGIIDKFATIADDPTTLEKVAQKYLFNHLWLLDPAWDRVTGRADMEVTLTEHIKRVVPDSSGARLDISYRSSSGRHIVVELKKPSLKSLSFSKIIEQVNKYKKAVEEFYKTKHPGTPVPALDIYMLLSKTPVGFDEGERNALSAVYGRIITYSELIANARNSYQEYLDAKTKIGNLEAILRKLGG